MNLSFAPFSLKITLQRVRYSLSHLWRRLTEPVAPIQEPEQRRQAQFLASLLLVILLLATLLTPLAAHLINPTQPFWQATSFQIAVITNILLLIAYSLSRVGRYRGAVTLAIGVMIIAIFAAAIPDRSWTEVLIFDYLLIVILISSVFFSISTTLIIVMACITGMLLFPTFVPTAPLAEIIIGPLNFILITSTLVLIAAHHRNQLERDRRAALAGGESKYRLLLEQAADGIFIANQQGNYIMVNPKGCQMVGYSLDELLQLNVKDIVPTEDLAQTPLRFDELLAGKTAIYERRLRRKDGSLLPVEISAKMLEDGRLQAIVRDVSERKQAEKIVAKRAVELEAVTKVSISAATILEVNQLLQTVVNLTKVSFNLYHAHIYLLNDLPTPETEGQEKALVLASGAGEVGQKMVAQGWKIPLDQEQSLVARAARQRQGVIVNDVQADPNFLPNPMLPETRSEMAIPMIWGEQLLGVFDVQSDQINHFTDEDIHIQTILATQVTVALQNAREYQRAQTALAEQQRLAAELDNQRRTLEAILQNIPAGVFVAEAPSGKLLLTNEQAEVILGRDMAPALAAAKAEWSEAAGIYLYGSDQLYPTGQMPLLQGMLGTTTKVDNMEIRRPNGQRILLEVAGAPVRNSQGEITASVAIVQDITERKQAEENLRRYTERLKDLRTIDQAILAAWSLEAIAESAISHIRRLVPCLKVSLILFDHESGTSLALAMSNNGETKIKPGTSFPLANAIMEKLRQGQVEVVEDTMALSPVPEALQYLRAEGIRSYIAAPLLAQNELIGSLNLLAGKPKAFGEQDIEIAAEVADQLAIAIKHARLYEQVQGQAAELEERVTKRTAELAAANQELANEVAERKQAEEAIKQLNRDLKRRAIQLEGANKELEAFSYSVSHDLRAPLRAIDGFSQALLEEYAEKLDEGGQDYLRRVRAATQRMGQLIDDMLNLSRITRSDFRRQHVNLSALAATVAWDLRQTQLDRQVEFIIAPSIAAEGDSQLLQVALENLLGNAWKFTQKQAQATIEFGVTQPQGQLTYFVRDNGVGFDMAFADKLFGPFQRLHGRNEFEGTGIGLATVQRIIQRHGGRVWAEAAVGKGATFFFTLT